MKRRVPRVKGQGRGQLLRVGRGSNGRTVRAEVGRPEGKQKDPTEHSRDTGVQPLDSGYQAFMVLYLNVGAGRNQADLGLQLAAKADVVFIAEALEDQKRRNQHVAYSLVVNTAYLGFMGGRVGRGLGL